MLRLRLTKRYPGELLRVVAGLDFLRDFIDTFLDLLHAWVEIRQDLVFGLGYVLDAASLFLQLLQGRVLAT